MRFKFFGILFLCCLVVFACTKSNRVGRKIRGEWVLKEMRIIDGQGFTHYIDAVSGSLTLDFDNHISEGLVSFQIESINNNQLFINNFSGDSLEYNADLDVLYMGENQERRVFSLILYNSRDLVLEYYDLLSYQLRKFIFTRD